MQKIEKTKGKNQQTKIKSKPRWKSRPFEMEIP